MPEMAADDDILYAIQQSINTNWRLVERAELSDSQALNVWTTDEWFIWEQNRRLTYVCIVYTNKI